MWATRQKIPRWPVCFSSPFHIQSSSILAVQCIGWFMALNSIFIHASYVYVYPYLCTRVLGAIFAKTSLRLLWHCWFWDDRFVNIKLILQDKCYISNGSIRLLIHYPWCMKNDKTYKTWLDKTKPVTFTMVNFDFDFVKFLCAKLGFHIKDVPLY